MLETMAPNVLDTAPTPTGPAPIAGTVTIPRRELLAAARTIKAATGARPRDLTVTLEARPDGATLTGGTLDTLATVTLPGACLEAGADGYYVANLADLVAAVGTGAGTVTFAPVAGGLGATITYGAVTVSIPEGNVDAPETWANYGSHLDADGATTLDLGDLEHVAAVTSKDDARPILTAVALVTTSAGGTEAVGTDSYRLRVVDVAPVRMLHGTETLIPARTIKAAGAAVKGGKNAPPRTVAVKVAPLGHLVTLDAGSVTITAHTIAGTYPNYQQLIPNRAEMVHVAMDATALRAFVETARKLDRESAVRFTWGDLAAPAPTVELAHVIDAGPRGGELGTLAAAVPFRVIGRPEAVGTLPRCALRAEFLADSLDTLGTGEVAFWLAAGCDLKPTILGGRGLGTLTMPVRLGDGLR